MATMTHKYLLAHDLGTTGNKATLFDVDGGVVKVSIFEPCPTLYIQPGWAEQDPAYWQRAIWQCTHRLISHLGALVFGGNGVGVFSDFSVIDRLIAIYEIEYPEPARLQHYAALLDFFQTDL